MTAIPDIIILLYAGLNLAAFVSFALDKFKARRNAWRTPERTLLSLAVFGPFGALAAMVVFRHKTRHVKFVLVPVFVILHTMTIVWLFGYFPK